MAPKGLAFRIGVPREGYQHDAVGRLDRIALYIIPGLLSLLISYRKGAVSGTEGSS